MDESLKSARNIHQLIIIASTIIVVFAFSASPEPDPFASTLRKIERMENTINGMFTDSGEILILLESGEHRRDTITELFLQNVRTKFSIERIESAVTRGEMSHDPRDPIGRKLRAILFRKGENTMTYFNELGSPVWDLIKTKTIPDAKKILEERSREYSKNTSGEIDVSGIKVTKELLYIVGPMILVFLLTYLYTLSKHVSRSDKELDKIPSFPWLALFPDVQSQAICVLSLLVYPGFAGVFIIARSNTPQIVKFLTAATFLTLIGTVYWRFVTYIILVKKNAWNEQYTSIQSRLRKYLFKTA